LRCVGYICGTVDDAIANTHTLIARAASVESGPTDVADVPRIIFGGRVGSIKSLYDLQAITGVQSVGGGAMPGDIDVASTIASPFTMIGQIIISDSVTTFQDQTYVANAIDIGGGSAKVILDSDKGIINIYAGQDFNHPFLSGGVKAIDGAQIALKGKFSRGTSDSFKVTGVKFAQGPRGGFVDAALASVLSKMKDKATVEYETSVVVGTDCEKAFSEECKI